MSFNAAGNLVGSLSHFTPAAGSTISGGVSNSLLSGLGGFGSLAFPLAGLAAGLIGGKLLGKANRNDMLKSRRSALGKKLKLPTYMNPKGMTDFFPSYRTVGQNASNTIRGGVQKTRGLRPATFGKLGAGGPKASLPRGSELAKGYKAFTDYGTQFGLDNAIISRLDPSTASVATPYAGLPNDIMQASRQAGIKPARFGQPSASQVQAAINQLYGRNAPMQLASNRPVGQPYILSDVPQGSLLPDEMMTPQITDAMQILNWPDTSFQSITGPLDPKQAAPIYDFNARPTGNLGQGGALDPGTGKIAAATAGKSNLFNMKNLLGLGAVGLLGSSLLGGGKKEDEGGGSGFGFESPFGSLYSQDGVTQYNPNRSQLDEMGDAQAQFARLQALGQLGRPMDVDSYYNNPFYESTRDLLQSPIKKEKQRFDQELNNQLSAQNQLGSSYAAMQTNLGEERFNDMMHRADLQARQASADAYNQSFTQALNTAATTQDIVTSMFNNMLAPLQMALNAQQISGYNGYLANQPDIAEQAMGQQTYSSLLSLLNSAGGVKPIFT